MTGEARHSKPLGRKAYGSVPHLPGSRLGPSDSSISPGQAEILCNRARDRHDRIIVTEKLDGSNCAVARIGGEILALTRAGYLADTSPFVQHHHFSRFVERRKSRYAALLEESERVVGEWLIQAHGGRYALENADQLFCAFDIIATDRRILHDEVQERCRKFGQATAPVLSDGPPLSVEEALSLAGENGRYGGIDPVEGCVWRAERRDRFDFMAKFVRHDKQDGILLPELTGKEPVWNWDPQKL